MIEQHPINSIFETNSPRCTQQRQQLSFSSIKETIMGINVGEKELFFALLAFIFLTESWYMYHKYLQTKQQQQTDDCYNNKAAKNKSKEEIEKVVNSLMHKVIINT